MINRRKYMATCATAPLLFSGAARARGLSDDKQAVVDHIQGEIAGEVTSNGIILQTRLTAPAMSADIDVPGMAGVARFEIDKDESFSGPIRTEWLHAEAKHDFILQKKIGGLKPDTVYHYRIEFGTDEKHTSLGPARKFRTLPGAAVSRKYCLSVVT